MTALFTPPPDPGTQEADAELRAAARSIWQPRLSPMERNLTVATIADRHGLTDGPAATLLALARGTVDVTVTELATAAERLAANGALGADDLGRLTLLDRSTNGEPR